MKMLFEKKNLVEELIRKRNAEVQGEDFLATVKAILEADEKQREIIRLQLGNNSHLKDNTFRPGLLESDNVFHLDQIKAICIDYRLRFLDSSLFKGDVPEEAISKIKQLEKIHGITISGFKIMAPSKQFHLKNYDDPLLFAPIGNNYYYLIHKWGNDLSPYRKMLVRPLRNFGSLLIFLLAVSALFTAAIAGVEVKGVAHNVFLLLMFLFIFKSLCGAAIYYCFWKGKNFNTAIWDSEYYNK